MKIKSLITLILACAVCIPAMADDQDNTRKEKDTYWFAGAGGGMNFTIDGQKSTRDASHNGAGTAIDVYFGRRFNKFAAFRLGFQGLSSSNQFTDYGKDKFGYAHADALFHIKEWLVPYVHAGYAYIEKGSGAGGVGIMAPIRISKHVSLVPDVRVLAHSNRLFTDGQHLLGTTLTGTLGLMIKMGNGVKKPAAPAPVILPPEKIYVKDTVYIDRETVRVDTVYRDLPKKEREINDALLDIVLFDFDSYRLTDEAKGILNDAAVWFIKNDDVQAVIEGHTDSVGSDEYNNTLSSERAKAVKDYLVSRGVEESRLDTIGYGKTRPVTDNSTAELRHRNRRIEFRLTMPED